MTCICTWNHNISTCTCTCTCNYNISTCTCNLNDTLNVGYKFDSCYKIT